MRKIVIDSKNEHFRGEIIVLPILIINILGADILMGKNKDVSGHEVSHLLSHFDRARVDGGRLEEFSEVFFLLFFFLYL